MADLWPLTQYDQARRALNAAHRILEKNEHSLGKLSALSGRHEMSDQRFRDEAAAKGVSLSPPEFKRNHLNYVISMEDHEAERIFWHIGAGEMLENARAPNKGPAVNRRGDFETTLASRGAPAAAGVVCDALDDVPALPVERVEEILLAVLTGPPRPFLTNIGFESTVRELCGQHRAAPQVAQHARQLAFAFERLGRVYYEGEDYPMAALLFFEVHAIDQDLLTAHPASLDLRRNFATSLFNLAQAQNTATRWRRACEFLEQLSRERRLMKRDTPYRELACQQASLARE